MDEEGFTPLVRAVLAGSRTMVDFLIENKANLQIRCLGKSPWEWALSKDKPDAGLAQFLEDSYLFLNGFRRAKQTGYFSDAEIILGANPTIANSFQLIIGYRDTSLLDLQLGEMFLQLRKDIEEGSIRPSTGTPFSYCLNHNFDDHGKKGFRRLIAEEHDLFQASIYGISPYGHIVRYKYPDTDAFPFMQVWAKVENDKAFDSCRTIGDFFEKIFPVDRQALLEWKCEKLPDLSVLEKEIQALIENGAVLPSEAEIDLKSFNDLMKIDEDRFKAVNSLSRQNPIFEKIWKKAMPLQFANHRELFKYSINIKGMANLLCAEAVLGLYSEPLKKIEEEAKNSREKYVYEWVAVMKQARGWMEKLGYSDGLEFEKFMDVSAKIARKKWDRFYSEGYMLAHRADFEERIKKMKD